VLRATGHDRLIRAGIVGKSRIVGLPSIVAILSESGAMTNRASLQRQGAIDARVWTSNTRHGYAHRFDSPHVMTRIIDVEQRFREGNKTRTRLFQPDETDRIDRLQRDVFDDL